MRFHSLLAKPAPKPSSPNRRRPAKVPWRLDAIANRPFTRSAPVPLEQHRVDLLAASGVWAKLEVGDAASPMERQADAIANRVVNTPTAPSERTDRGTEVRTDTDADAQLEDDFDEQLLVDGPSAGFSTTLERACASCSSAAEEEEAIQRSCSACEEDEQLERQSWSGRGQQAESIEAAACRKGGIASTAFERRLQSARSRGGEPLDDTTRSFIEHRMHVSFDHIKIHHDWIANELARSIGARAFAHGQHIFFASGQLRPRTREGLFLITHEVVHTIQHRQGHVDTPIRRYNPNEGKPGAEDSEDSEAEGVQLSDEDTEAEAIMDTVVIPWRSTIERSVRSYVKRLTKDKENVEAVTAAVMQNTRACLSAGGSCLYLGDESISSIAEFESSMGKSESEQLVLYGKNLEIIRQGTGSSVSNMVDVGRQLYFENLSHDDKRSINWATDERFWSETGAPRNSKIDKGDSEAGGDWVEMRNDYVAERQRIEALPAWVRALLISEDAPTVLEPEDYGKFLGAAEMLSRMSTEQLLDYTSRVGAEFESWTDLENSIRFYLLDQAQQQELLASGRDIIDRLRGQEKLYDAWVDYKVASSTAGGGMDGPMQQDYDSVERLRRLSNEIDAKMRAEGFDGVAEFKAYIDAFEAHFQDVSLVVADNLLAHFEGQLHREEKRYQGASAGKDLSDELSLASSKHAEAVKLRASINASTYSGQTRRTLSQQRSAADAALAEAVVEAEFARVEKLHPLIANFDKDEKQELADADADETQELMLEYIEDTRKSINHVRGLIHEDPTMVWGLDMLAPYALATLQAHEDPIFAKIVAAEAKRQALRRIIPDIVLAIAALAFAVFSGGLGIPAVITGATLLMVGVVDALREYQRYEEQQAAADAQLSSQEPSPIWVVVALLGVGIDIAVVYEVVRVAGIVRATKAFDAAPSLTNAQRLENLRVELEAIDTLDPLHRAQILQAAERKLMGLGDDVASELRTLGYVQLENGHWFKFTEDGQLVRCSEYCALLDVLFAPVLRDDAALQAELNAIRADRRQARQDWIDGGQKDDLDTWYELHGVTDERIRAFGDQLHAEAARRGIEVPTRLTQAEEAFFLTLGQPAMEALLRLPEAEYLAAARLTTSAQDSFKTAWTTRCLNDPKGEYTKVMRAELASGRSPRELQPRFERLAVTSKANIGELVRRVDEHVVESIKGTHFTNPQPNPLTPQEFQRLPQQGTVNARRLSFGQSGCDYWDKTKSISLDDNIRALLGPDHASVSAKIPIIEIYLYRGVVYTHDHRRVVAFQAANREIHYQKFGMTDGIIDEATPAATRTRALEHWDEGADPNTIEIRSRNKR